MAQVPLRKNPGPPLVSKTIGDVELIPREYRAKIGTKRTVQKQPVDIELSEIGDLLVESSVVQDLTDERKKTNIELIGEIETPLIDETFITGSGQIGHHTRQLVPEGTELTVDALTESADQHNLGNGFLDQNVVSVEEVFPNTVSKMERRHVTPPEFDALIPIQYFENVDDAPFELVTNLFAGDIDRSNEEVTEFHTKHTNTFRDLIDLPVQIVDSETNRFKQIKYVVKILDSQDTFPPNPTSTQDVSWTHLGDETAVTRIEGTEDLFDQHTYERIREDVTPEWAKALQTTLEESFLEEGLAGDPDPLGIGEFLKRQQQEDVFNRRVTTRTRNLDLPVQVVDSATNKYKQTVVITKTLDLEAELPPPPDAFSDVTFTHLGDGTAVTQIEAVEDVFDQLTASIEVADLVPEIFRAVIPITTEEFVTTGTTIDDPPTLGTGDLFRSESRETEETIRVRTRGRSSISYPQNVVASKQLGAERFGGEHTVIDALLDDSEPLVEFGENIVDSKVTNLGNGTWVRQTEKRDEDYGPEWPTLESRLWDEVMRVEYDETRQVVDAGTSEDADPGGVFGWVSEVKTIDQWHSWKINTSKPTPDYLDPNTALVTWEMKPYRFPGYIQFSGLGYYVRSADAVVCKHRIKTWFVQSSNPPPEPTTDTIITGDAIINNLEGTGLEYARNVLYDGFTIGIISYGPTTPTATEYAFGTVSGSTDANLVQLAAPGSGYSLGDSLSISGDGGTATITVTNLGIDNSIRNYTPVIGTPWSPAGTYGPYPASGGSGTGAYFNVIDVDVPTFVPGSAWIGTYRIVGGSVKPAREKDIWIYQTEEVIMR